MPTTNSVAELVAGPFAAAVSTIWPGPRMAEFLAASDRRRQVWYACLASDSNTFSPDRNEVGLLQTRLASWRAKDLIVQAYGCRPRGALGVIGRLGSRAREPEIYQLVMDVMERGGHGAKLLMHATSPSDQLIETIAAVPADMNWPALDAAVGSPRIEHPESLAMLLWTVARLRLLDPDRGTESILSARQPISALLNYLIDRALPKPPWPGTNWLRPLATGPDLLLAGEDFHNCLAKGQWGEAEIMGVLNGTKYLYEWTGSERVLIEVLRVADIGWFVSEARGVKNADVSRATRREIVNAFAAAPHICATRLVIRSNIYPCSQFWGEIVCRAMMR